MSVAEIIGSQEHARIMNQIHEEIVWQRVAQVVGVRTALPNIHQIIRGTWHDYRVLREAYPAIFTAYEAGGIWHGAS